MKDNLDKTHCIVHEYMKQQTRITELEDLLFFFGAMNFPPCFCCGYNGPGYYQPEKHKCVHRHYASKNSKTGR